MRRVAVTDVAAALALAAFMTMISSAVRTTQPGARPMNLVGVVLLVLCGGALVLRRVAPYVAYAGAVGTAVTYLALRLPGWPVYIGGFVGLIALVSAAEDRRWVAPAAVGGVGLCIASGPIESWNAVRMITVAIVWAAVAVFGHRLAQGRRWLAVADAARQVAEERLRIARELHDVLSHSLAAMSLRAGVGLHLLDRDPDAVRGALMAIRQISSDALGQARSALAAVRDPHAEPGLAHLDGLAASFRALGMELKLHIGPDDHPVPPAIGAAAYRIVQEALTNVLRHAGPDARVEASVGNDDGCLKIDIRDHATASRPAGPPGHGLRGMHERAESLGGTCSAGFVDGSGFVVRAWLPLPSVA